MSRFVIEKLILSGGGHVQSVINFSPGLNFILGPSNTGKSLVMESIDYVFGYKPDKRHPSKIVDNSYGYESITLQLATGSGTVMLERKIGSPKIEISSTDPTVDPGTYSIIKSAKKNVNSIYLHLLGIDEPHSIRKSREGSKVQDLTWRSILYLFFIKQADVARETSPLLSPSGFSDVSSAAALLFLLTGQDANDLSPEEDVKIMVAKKNALIDYMRGNVNRFAQRREELEDALSRSETVEPEDDIDQVRQEIHDIQDALDDAARESQQLMAQIYEWNGKLSECNTVIHNFSVLRQQYQTDIRRIGFIVEGMGGMGHMPEKVICPVCGEEVKRIRDISFIDASASELEKTKRHLDELSAAQESISKQQRSILAKIKELEEKKDTVDKIITDQLQPKLSAFEEKLQRHMEMMRLSGEFYAICQTEEQYREELFEKENEETPEVSKYNIYDDYDYDTISGFEKKLREILSASKIGGASTARLNMENFDIEIEGKKKSVSAGGGLCGILNTITTLAMSAYLIENDGIAPGFYAVDSSLTQLSEADYITQSDTIKQNFIEYLIKHANDRQVIIIEQTKRMPFIPKTDRERNIQVTLFSKNKEEGRYGFLNDVYNPEDQ